MDASPNRYLQAAVRVFRLRRALRRGAQTLSSVGDLLGRNGMAPNAEQVLTRLLVDNIVPFWTSKGLDRRFGGFHLNHSMTGEDRGPCRKYVISQARMTWFFASLGRSRYGTDQHLDIARSGYDLLTNQFLDPEFGGYFYSFDPESSGDPSESFWIMKDLCAQAYVLYALSEYALATQSAAAARHANALFALIQERTVDRRFGGYQELFLRDWRVAPASLSYHHDSDSAHKTFAAQVHLLEALTLYHTLDRGVQALQALERQLDAVLHNMVHAPSYLVTAMHRNDWRIVAFHTRNEVNYGHALELTWMLGEAAIAAGRKIADLETTLECLFANTVRSGMDADQGGFYSSGVVGGRVSNTNKVWWVQAEALLSSCRLFSYYGKPEYADCFNKTLQWIAHRQADWGGGEWFERIDQAGESHGIKAGEWKAAYHSGRSVLQCLSVLASEE